MRILLVALSIFCIIKASAQTEKMYAVKMGEIPNQVIPAEAIYLFPGFSQGLVYFKNGGSSTQWFNYNSLLDEMDFISEKGDTLAIAEPALLKVIEIDSVKFYYEAGYVQQIFARGNYVLAIKHKWRRIPGKKTVGYDAGSSTGSINEYSTINTGNGSIGKLRVLQDVLFTKENYFYIGDKFNHFRRANKKNFYVLFGDKKIARYLQDHRVNFDNAGDLIALLQFCAG